jgi:hypothetical protein
MLFLYRNEYRNLKLADATMGRGLGRCEEDSMSWTQWGWNTYMYGNNTRKLPGLLSLSQSTKTSCFSLFYIFSSTKSQNRRAEQVLPRGQGGRGGLAPVRRQKWQGKVLGQWVSFKKKCIHLFVNANMIPVETVTGIGGGG